MNEKNLKLIYSAALLAGYAFPITGIISPQIALSLGVKTSDIVMADSLILAGLTVGGLLSGKIVDIYGGRNTALFSVVALCLINICLSFQNILTVYAILVFLNGMGMGLLVSSVNYLVITMSGKSDNESDSKLNIMQFFVGIGCFIGTVSAGTVAYYFSWRAVFMLVAVLYFILIIVIRQIAIKLEKLGKPKDSISIKESLPMAVILVGLALISYVYIEYIVSYWFSPYLQDTGGFNVKSVGYLIGVFWLMIAFGRMIFGKFVLPRVSDFTFIITVSLFTAFGFVLFMISKNIVVISVAVFLLGLTCSAIYPTLIAFGMKIMREASSYTLSFLITCGFSGGILSLLCSGFIGRFLPKIVPIMTGPVWCFLIIALIILSKRKRTD